MDAVLDVLGSAAWQGIGAMFAAAALVAYLWFDVLRRRRRRGPSTD